jgi:hypothetical protein
LEEHPVHERSNSSLMRSMLKASFIDPQIHLVSLCAVCFRQKRQYLLNSIRSVVFFLFFVVL